MEIYALCYLTLLCILCGFRVVFSCSFPTNLASKTWRDSDKGDLIFTSNQMTGWNFKYISTTTAHYAPTWECYDLTTDGQDTILILKASLTIQYSLTIFNRPFLCMRLRQITDASYYYYLQYAEQPLLDYERITVIFETLVSGLTNPFESLCLNSSSASLSDSEYHVLVQKGNEAQAIQDCPRSLYELYTYSITDTNSSTTVCDTGNSRLDMCSDIKRMVFDYTLCNDIAAYSANGSLYCLVVLNSGANMFHTVYNEDTSVDGSNTFQFTCFMSSVASDGTVSMSVSPRSCTRTQTPTDQPQLGNGTLWGVNMNLTPIQSVLTCDFPCSFPSTFANINWTDSDKGDLRFTNESMTGWYFYAYNSLVTPTWKCFYQGTVDDSTIIIVRASSTLSVLGGIFRPFLCLKLHQITTASYYYYLLRGEQSQLGYERITLRNDSTEAAISDAFFELCVNTSDAVSYPVEHEYHILIKQGSEASVKVDCPSAFYGIYSYTVEDKDSGTTSCGYNDTRWDVCTDYQRMAINYTHCPTTVAHSGTGNLFCVLTLTTGSNVIHTVYNEDPTVDNTNTHRFTCFISTISNDGNLTVSQSPGSCTRNQTATDQPISSNGTIVGLNLHLSPFENGLCPIVEPSTPSTPSSDTSSTDTVVIVGSVVGSLVLLGLIGVILACVLCNACCCKRGAKVDSEMNNNDVKKKTKGQLVDERSEKPDNDKIHEVEIEEFDHKEPSTSCVDIASLSHVRTFSRMDTSVGFAPEDTKFNEPMTSRSHNSFTLPLLLGKSPRSSSARGSRLSESTSVMQSMSLSIADTSIDQDARSLVGDDEEVLGNNDGENPSLREKVEKASSCVIAPTIVTSEVVKCEEKGSKRNNKELPDNPEIINSHFQQQNMAYMNNFMDLPRKETVGPENDHEFREKRTYSDKIVSIAKANTVLSMMSKASDLNTFEKEKTPQSKENSKKQGEGKLSLERSKTYTAYRNKTGEFLVGSIPVPANTFVDESKDGIAYDDDNYKARKQVHFSSEGDFVRELSCDSFKYGVVRRGNNDVKGTNGLGKDDNLTDDIPDNDEDTIEDNEDIEEDDGNDASFEIDDPTLQTAMSVMYSESGDDPDKMSLRGYEL